MDGVGGLSQGSHRWKDVASRSEATLGWQADNNGFLAPAVQAVMPQGSAVFFSGWTLHCSGVGHARPHNNWTRRQPQHVRQPQQRATPREPAPVTSVAFLCVSERVPLR